MRKKRLKATVFDFLGLRPILKLSEKSLKAAIFAKEWEKRGNYFSFVATTFLEKSVNIQIFRINN